MKQDWKAFTGFGNSEVSADLKENRLNSEMEAGTRLAGRDEATETISTDYPRESHG